MKKEIFGIPIFEDKVDVTKFDIIPRAPLEPTWDSGVPSTFSSQKQELIPEDIWTVSYTHQTLPTSDLV